MKMRLIGLFPNTLSKWQSNNGSNMHYVFQNVPINWPWSGKLLQDFDTKTEIIKDHKLQWSREGLNSPTSKTQNEILIKLS